MPTDVAKLQRSPREVARWQSAQRQLLGDDHRVALASYRDLVQRFPGIGQLWFELGIAAAGELEFETAERAFRRAEELAAGDAAMLVLVGQQYHRLRRLDQARSCFERAVAAQPSSVHAQLSLAAWYEREGRLADAWKCVEACSGENPQVQCSRAMLLHRNGRNTEAESVLRDLIRQDSSDPNVRFTSRQLLGAVLDSLGEYAEAFKWLCESKTAAARTADTEQMTADYDKADNRRRELLANLKTETIQRWREEGAAEPCRFQLAFLGGHPRSGTTLLEQILGAHPGILAFDEPEAFVHEVWNQLAPMQATQALTLKTLNRLNTPQRAVMRRRYWKSLLREVQGEPNAQVLLDKNPSPTASLHLWLRIFPELKVLIALRDPRDVVLSCFFQTLMLTPANANFLTLERTAKHYADLMDVWLRMRELGGFDWLETRYEDVVTNVEREGRRVTEFLGLTWHPNQARHHEAAQKKILFAPTYNDAAKPVHNRAVGRWKNYTAELTPIQERLARYCKAFGYG